MYQFFKTMEAVANLDPREYKDVKDLVIDIAKSGNYRREEVTLKNGKKVLRTKYGKVDSTGKVVPCWDEALVAKWYVFYKKFFISRLVKHPELEEYYPDIFSKTFSIYFNALNIDKITSGASITVGLEMCFRNRITYHLRKLGSKSREEKLDNMRKIKRGLLDPSEVEEGMVAKRYIETYATRLRRNTVSLDEILDNEDLKNMASRYLEDPTSNISEDSLVVFEIKKRLEEKGLKEEGRRDSVILRLGTRLLEALMFSEKKVRTKKLSEYMDFTKSEKEDSKTTLKNIKEAYNIIKQTVLDFMPSIKIEEKRPVRFRM